MYVNELMSVFLRKIDALRRTETLINASGATRAARPGQVLSSLTFNAAEFQQRHVLQQEIVCPHVHFQTEETDSFSSPRELKASEVDHSPVNHEIHLKAATILVFLSEVCGGRRCRVETRG